MTSEACAAASSGVKRNFTGSEGEIARDLDDPALALGLEGPAVAVAGGFLLGADGRAGVAAEDAFGLAA